MKFKKYKYKIYFYIHGKQGYIKRREEENEKLK